MKKIGILLAFIIVIAIGALALQQFFIVRKAHSNFANYYAFRGCTKLITKTDTSATCQLANGKVIKIVKVNNKWYLDGDLPVCYFHFCI